MRKLVVVRVVLVILTIKWLNRIAQKSVHQDDMAMELHSPCIVSVNYGR